MRMSHDQILYLKKIKRKKYFVFLMQCFIVIGLLGLWEVLARYKVINPFIFSSPFNIVKTIISLAKNGNLFIHIFTTLYETLISFGLGMILGILIAILLYSNETLFKIFDPFLTMLNSLPKVALGPMIIIWVGANTNSIIVMALCINLIVSIVTVYNGFLGIDQNKINLLKSFGATRIQVLTKLVIPGSYPTIISSLKLNISMSLIGVIMGEFLVSRKGLGYLIIYGTQIFNLNLVMSGIFILIIISYLLYKIITLIEKKLLKK